MKQDGQDTCQDSTVTVFSYLSCRVRGERPSMSSWSSKLSVSSPANGSSWYGLTSEEYSASSYSDDPLSETTEETEENSNSFSHSQEWHIALCCSIHSVQTQWRHGGVALSPIFAGGYQAEIVQNRMNDPFSPTKWIGSLTKEGLYYLNMK